LDVVKESITSRKLSMEDTYQMVLCIPIHRGMEDGIVGNGRVIMMMWEEVEKAEGQKKKDISMALKTHLTSDLSQLPPQSHVYYHCPLCIRNGRECYL
jgi:hypothetical protein